jgi:hypothetical protein
MRKIIVTLLVIALMLTIAGCGKDAEPAPAPAPAPVVEPEPVVIEPEPEPELIPIEVDEEAKTTEIKEELYEEGSCVDTDGGENYAVAGEVWDTDGGHDDDTCSRSKIYENRLYEVVCGEDGTKERITYECPNGCVEGACVE